VKKYGTARQAIDDNTMWHMSIACWITKAIKSRSEYTNLLLFHGNNGYSSMPQCYKYIAYLVSYCSVASKVLIYIIILCRCACSVVFHGWRKSTLPDADIIPTAGKRSRKQWLPIASACGLKQSMNKLANSLLSLSKRNETHVHD